MKNALCLAVLVLTLGASSASQAPHQMTREHPSAFATNKCYPKGGLGIINTSLYIVLRSERDELLLEGGKKWTGQQAGTLELVIIYGNRVWQSQALPKDFDLSKATVVSFEAKRVRFFDFNQMEGGFYLRGENQN